MKSNIFIPKKINVGFQNRAGTYTGKLAYIIYYDEKGILRKEKSWSSWRDTDIPNIEFDNIPMDGFVLNKKVGDYSSGWDHRQAYCRVYDPRDFEFEISIENLLYILENTNSIKGKGLEGEFVYGWDGTDLILMPVESPDYKEIYEYNSIVHNSEHIKAKDLKIGATYLTKENVEWIYMGKFDYYNSGYSWLEKGETKSSKSYKDIPTEICSYGSYPVDHKYLINYPYGKYFWFAYKSYDYQYVNGERVKNKTFRWDFEQVKSIPKGKIIKCLDSDCVSNYADVFDEMESSYKYSPYDESMDTVVDMTLEEFVESSKSRYSNGFFYTDSYFISNYDGVNRTYRVNSTSGQENLFILRTYYSHEEILNIFPIKVELIDTWRHGRTIQEEIKHMIPVTLEKIYEVMKPKYIQKYLANGREYEKEYKNE